MNGLPAEYATVLRLEKRIRDLELLVDRLIKNEAAMYQGLVSCEARLADLEEETIPPVPEGVAN